MALTTQDLFENGLERLAIGCMHLITNRATLHFPTSTQAAPSAQVVVDVTFGKALDPSFRQHFPFEVPALMWQNAVVPVLEDPAFRLTTTSLVPVVLGAPTTKVQIQTTHVVKALVSNESWPDLIEHLRGALLQSFQDAGYLPTGETLGAEADEVIPDPPAPGEPASRPVVTPVSYEQFDC